jgi:hypothetical protein
VAFCNAHGPVQQLFIDGTGLGGGLVDHLRRRGFLVTDVQFGAKAIDEIDGVRYANISDGADRPPAGTRWWAFAKDAMRRRGVSRWRRGMRL